MLQEIKKGFKTFLASAIQHNADFDNFELEWPNETPLQSSRADLAQVEGQEALADVMTKYIDEGKHTEVWKPKTLEEKQDAHGLLVEIIGNKPIGSVSKSDARKAKEVLLKLPKNRRKMSVTRDLSLEDMLNGRRSIRVWTNWRRTAQRRCAAPIWTGIAIKIWRIAMASR